MSEGWGTLLLGRSRAVRAAGEGVRMSGDGVAAAADRIGRDLVALATPAGRKPGTAGHAAARTFLEGRIAALGLAPYRPLITDPHRHQYRTRSGLTMTNLFGVVPGAAPDARTREPFLLAAHYDSVIEAPCADDNAAAVAVVLEVAARLQSRPLERDVIIALFDGEEPPFFLTMDMGSMRFAEEVMLQRPALAVVLDLVGHAVELPIPGADPNMIFVAGAETAEALPSCLSGLALPTIAVNSGTVGDFSDYAAFRHAGVPFLFWSCGEWPAYHTAQDLPDGVRLDKCARLADDLETVLRRADAAGVMEGTTKDCTAFEAQTLEDVLGRSAVAGLAERYGVDHWTADGMALLMARMRAGLRMQR